ncbi:MAG: endolytic transglycosylase MltG [Alphaproteobacteria bacterium]|nr:endolytic transglycosylase MltG [Alphaproteobacteria bacterium]
MRATLLFVAAVSTVGACVDADAPLHPEDTDVFLLEVPAGATARGLTPTLQERGVVDSPWAWRWFLRSADAGCLKAGRHRIRRSMSMRELVEALCGVPVPEDEPFTVVEGWRIEDIDAALAAKGWIAAGAYAALATTKAVDLPFDVTGPTLEGYLFPETYRVEPDRFEASAFIERQLATFQQRFLVLHPDLGGRSLHDVVVMASMLEREEPSPTQRAVVAGILWKRLDAGWKLGVDATSRYQLDDWSDRRAFLAKLRDPDDPYNTRLRDGLPPTAIGNPGLASLQAALAPEVSDWWYYLHDSTGTFHGARDAAGHAANKARYDVY